MLNKQAGNMYPWVTHTWNPIKGRCPYQCSYCYYQANPYYKDRIGKLRLDEKALKDKLGEARTIFVGSSTDMWADEVPRKWINRVIYHCMNYPNNVYLFQTKNPNRFHEFKSILPKTNILLGTTIETNFPTFSEQYSNAPSVFDRSLAMSHLGFNKMVSIEPIMDFSLKEMVGMIKLIKPKFVSIGADSKGHNLPEPSSEKVRMLVRMLIQELKKFTEVCVKPNLRRIYE